MSRRTANKKLTKLCWPSLTKTTNCTCRPKKVKGHDKFFSGTLRRTCAPTFKFVPARRRWIKLSIIVLKHHHEVIACVKHLLKHCFSIFSFWRFTVQSVLWKYSPSQTKRCHSARRDVTAFTRRRHDTARSRSLVLTITATRLLHKKLLQRSKQYRAVLQ